MSTDYDFVIYDLDGTLVELTVDWDAVARDVDEVLRTRDVDTAGHSLWEMLGLSDETGHRDAVEAAIGEHERAGARNSQRLPLADELPLDAPVAVCSLNCEAACRVAVETHGLGDALVDDAIVGRDTVETHKPDPESVLAAVERLGGEPECALFVGDSRRDAVASERAGVPFAWATDLIER